MKKVITLFAAFVAAAGILSAQDVQKVAAKVAETLTAAKDVPETEPKTTYWTNSILNQINFGQTSL